MKLKRPAIYFITMTINTNKQTAYGEGKSLQLNIELLLNQFVNDLIRKYCSIPSSLRSQPFSDRFIIPFSVYLPIISPEDTNLFAQRLQFFCDRSNAVLCQQFRFGELSTL